MARITTEALVANEKSSGFELETIQLKEIRPDEALVDVHAVGICHTDLSCAEGIIPISYPAVLGHEGAGVIRSVGANLSHLSPGDRVLLSFDSCGSCRQCKCSMGCYCESYEARNFGGQRRDGTQALERADGQRLFSHFFGQSSFSKLAVVSGRSIVKLPGSTDLALFCSLGCGIQTGAGTILNTLDVQKGQSLAVFGTGAVGLSCIMAGKLRKAYPIIAVDINPERLKLAQELGATHAILSGDAKVNVVEQLKGLCPGNGVERAVDCSGVPGVIEDMIKALGSRGVAASVGAPAPGATVRVDVFQHIVKGASYVGSCEGDCDPNKMIPFLIHQQQQGLFPMEKLVTYYPVHEHRKAFADVRSGRAIKAVLLWE